MIALVLWAGLTAQDAKLKELLKKGDEPSVNSVRAIFQ